MGSASPSVDNEDNAIVLAIFLFRRRCAREPKPPPDPAPRLELVPELCLVLFGLAVLLRRVISEARRNVRRDFLVYFFAAVEVDGAVAVVVVEFEAAAVSLERIFARPILVL